MSVLNGIFENFELNFEQKHQTNQFYEMILI